VKRTLLCLLIGSACSAHHAITPAAPIAAGVTISLYSNGDPSTAYGVVDDRRWVELAGTELALEQIDPGASLASLVIEPLDAAPLAIVRCSREALPLQPPPAAKPAPATERRTPTATDALRVIRARIRDTAASEPKVRSGPIVVELPDLPQPPGTLHVIATVRCTVAGAPGRHLVRILYVSHSLGYRAQHHISMTAPDRAHVTTRYAFPTPAWHEHAEVTVLDGVPGGEKLPTELAHGAVALDGSIAILEPPPRDVVASLRRIYDGAVATPGVDVADSLWNAESTHAVWVWLELHAALAPGPVRAHVELAGEPVRDLELPASLRDVHPDPRGEVVRLPLWLDSSLAGSRLRFADPTIDADATTSERLMLSISNLGDLPREVWVEEHVRPARHRKIERAWPQRPTANGDVVREKLEVRPHAIARVGYTVTYEF
jgi:hypothetical protein